MTKKAKKCRLKHHRISRIDEKSTGKLI